MKNDTVLSEVAVRPQDIRALHARIKELDMALKAELDKKKDASIIDLEVEQLRALVGKHECSQVTRIALISSSMESIEKSVSNIEEGMNRWKNLRLGGVLAVLLALISGTAYIIRSEAKADTVQTSVRRIETDVADMKRRMDGSSWHSDEGTLKAIRDTIAEALSRK